MECAETGCVAMMVVCAGWCCACCAVPDTCTVCISFTKLCVAIIHCGEKRENTLNFNKRCNGAKALQCSLNIE